MHSQSGKAGWLSEMVSFRFSLSVCFFAVLCGDCAFVVPASSLLHCHFRLSLDSALVLEKSEKKFISIQMRAREQKKTCAKPFILQI